MEQGTKHWGVLFKRQAFNLKRIINETASSQCKLAQDEHRRAIDKAVSDGHALIDDMGMDSRHTVAREPLVLTDEQVTRWSHPLLHEVVPDSISAAVSAKARGYVNDIKAFAASSSESDHVAVGMAVGIKATKAALHLTLSSI